MEADALTGEEISVAVESCAKLNSEATESETAAMAAATLRSSKTKKAMAKMDKTVQASHQQVLSEPEAAANSSRHLQGESD